MKRQNRPPERHKITTTTTTKSKNIFRKKWKKRKIHFSKMENGKLVIKNKLKRQNRSTTEGFLLKKVFLKILQNSQENACARVSF